MKFIHTADWQIGMRAAHVGAVAGRVRSERLAAADRVVQAAVDQRADFILVAGDTFEDNAVDRVAVQKVADILGRFPGPVYLIAGNHDPWVAGSVWQHPAWDSHENLRLLSTPEPVEVPGGVLFPCPLREKTSPRDPTGWIDARHAETISVGIAHGTVEGVVQDTLEYPIARDAAARAGLDYLALGHWHSTATYEDNGGTVRMAYSGTHETTKFGERDSGNILAVEITSRGAPPEVTPIHTGGLAWRTIDEEIRSPGDLARVRQSVESMADPDNTLLEVRLSGLLHAAEQSELARIEEILAARFPFHRIDRGGLVPAPEDDRWLADFPPGPLKDAAGRLRELSDPAVTQGRPDYATPEIATRALVELYSILSKVRS
jgi:DNA repair exonuclease SbcCD nuclease subunit